MTGPRKLTALMALGLAMVAPAAAAASTGSTYGDYSKDGAIDGCDYSASDLQNAIGSVPTDVAQYDPRFKDALNRALAQRAAGCGSAGSASTEQNQPAAAAAAADDGSPKPPGPETSVALPSNTDLGSDSGFPAALGVLAGLVALIIAGTALVAWRRNRVPANRQGGFSFLSDYYWGIRDTIGR